jgi:hypothetical protein
MRLLPVDRLPADLDAASVDAIQRLLELDHKA